MDSQISIAASEILEEFTHLVLCIEEIEKAAHPVKAACCTQKLHGQFAALRQLPAVQLAELHQLLHKTPYWEGLPSVLEDCSFNVKQVGRITQPFDQQQKQQRANCQPTACTDGPSKVDVDDVVIALASEQIAVTVLQGIVDALPQTIDVLGTTTPNPAYYIALAAKVAVELVANGTNLAAAILQRAADVRDICQENAFQQMVQDMCSTLNAVKDSLDALHAKVDLLDQKVNYLLTLVVELMKLLETLYFFELETNITSCQPLISMYLPESVEGKLEEVQALLHRLLNSSITAGLDTYDAASFVKQGIQAGLSRQYCEALHWFRMAYQELLRSECCVQNKCFCKPEEKQCK